MERTSYLPDADRLSILSAVILLAYAASRFVDLPPREYDLQLPGLYLAVELNIYTIVALMVAGLTATGADLLLRNHPDLGDKWTVAARLDSLDSWDPSKSIASGSAMADKFRGWRGAADACPGCRVHRRRSGR